MKSWYGDKSCISKAEGVIGFTAIYCKPMSCANNEEAGSSPASGLFLIFVQEYKAGPIPLVVNMPFWPIKKNKILECHV